MQNHIDFKALACELFAPYFNPLSTDRGFFMQKEINSPLSYSLAYR